MHCSRRASWSPRSLWRPQLNAKVSGLLFCSYCTAPVTETTAGEFLCGRGASLSKLVGTRLRELVATPERRCSLEACASSKWHCPRCAVAMVRAGSETVCPACALNLTQLIYQILEFNPHVPAPSLPSEELRRRGNAETSFVPSVRFKRSSKL
jgi:hypothetical protein